MAVASTSATFTGRSSVTSARTVLTETARVSSARARRLPDRPTRQRRTARPAPFSRPDPLSWSPSLRRAAPAGPIADRMRSAPARSGTAAASSRQNVSLPSPCVAIEPRTPTSTSTSADTTTRRGAPDRSNSQTPVRHRNVGLQAATPAIEDHDTPSTLSASTSPAPDRSMPAARRPTRTCRLSHDTGRSGVATRRQSRTTMPRHISSVVPSPQAT